MRWKKELNAPKIVIKEKKPIDISPAVTPNKFDIAPPSTQANSIFIIQVAIPINGKLMIDITFHFTPSMQNILGIIKAMPKTNPGAIQNKFEESVPGPKIKFVVSAETMEQTIPANNFLMSGFFIFIKYSRTHRFK